MIDGARDVIVGATFAGPRVGEMLHAATIAIIGELRLLEQYRDERGRVFA